MTGWTGLRVGVVGPTSLVGRDILEALHERGVETEGTRLLGSVRAAGATLDEGPIRGRVELVGPTAFDGLDVALFAAGPTVAGEFGPAAVEAGAVVVDVSTRFRLAPDVPLVVPEVNPEAIEGRRERGIVASPSGTAVALALVLGPLAREVELRRVVVSTVQPASGAGRRAISRLARETRDLLAGRRRGRRRLAFDCTPVIGAIEPGGATTHELHVTEEVRKVLGNEGLALHVTAVRVPSFFGAGASVLVETDEGLRADGVTSILQEAAGLRVHGVDAPPTPARVVGDSLVHVGRVRDDPTSEGAVALWISHDGVRRGGAQNAVGIADLLVSEL